MNKRKTLAFLSDEIVYEYHAQVLHGIVDQARDMGVNIIVYPGYSINAPVEPAKHANQIYEFLDSHRVDGVLSLNASLLSFLGPAEKGAYFDRITKGLPAVSIGVEFPGHQSITVNNFDGMYQVVAHLVRQHGYKKVAFIGGPSSNTEAVARYSAYQKALQDSGGWANRETIGAF
ncbi:MAG: hypothetical protein ACOC2H_04555, partial [Spirochaetota bacterium]